MLGIEWLEMPNLERLEMSLNKMGPKMPKKGRLKCPLRNVWPKTSRITRPEKLRLIR